MAVCAEHGRLECLMYLRSMHIPWDYRVCKEALAHGHFELLEYAKANGCPEQQEQQQNQQNPINLNAVVAA